MRRFAVVAPRHLALLMVTLLSVGAIQPGEILAAGPAPSTEPVRDRAVEQLGPRVIERPVAELGSTSGGGSAGAGVGPTPGDVSIGVRPTTKQPPLDPREMWTEGSRTLVDANGRYTVEAVAGRMNYQDASGEWQPIDLTLVPDAAVAGYGLRTKANDRIVHFGQQDAGDALARLSTGKGTLAVRALDFQSSLVAGPGAPTPSPTPAPTVEPSASPSAPPPSASPTPGPSDPPDGVGDTVASSPGRGQPATVGGSGAVPRRVARSRPSGSIGVATAIRHRPCRFCGPDVIH